MHGRSIARLSLILLATACQSLDGFFYSPSRPVDGYDFAGLDPDLDGDLSEPHPSLVPAADREEGYLARVDGSQIHYVFAHRPGATGAILYSHGNTDHLGRYWDRVELLWSLGYHVLIYDYPGYGLSDGEPTEPGVYEASVLALARLRAGRDVVADRVWLYGFSLGGGPTYELAARAAAGQIASVRGVISESTFCSVEALVQDGACLDLPASFVATVRYDNCAKIATLAHPVLILHGSADDFVVPRHGTLLRERADTARLELVEGARHSDLPAVAEDYPRVIGDFLTATAP